MTFEAIEGLSVPPGFVLEKDALRTYPTADLFSFSYAFDAKSSDTTGHVLEGIVEGFLMEDRDTIVSSKLVCARLGGYDHMVTTGAAVRAADPADTTRRSFSGDELNFWVCERLYLHLLKQWW